MNLRASQWKTPPGSPIERPADHAIHLWRTRLIGTEPQYEAARGVISATEKARADRLISPTLGRRSVFAFAFLRLVLARYLPVEPAAISFETGPFGKPFLPDGPGFNLSHSGDTALIAVGAQGSEIGVDIEEVNPKRATHDIAARFFAPEEIAELAGYAEGDDRESAFFRIWTRKEAFIKAIGKGLAQPLDSFAVSADIHAPRLTCSRIEHEPADAWSFGDITAFEGFEAAVCARGRIQTLSGFTA